MTVDLAVLPGFLVAVAVILAAPGPDMVFMVTAGLNGGRRAATSAALGIASGVAVYVAVVSVGLGTLVVDHPSLLTVIQIAGSGYLGLLAVRSLRRTGRQAGCSTAHAPMSTISSASSAARWYRRGLLVNLANPKITLFFLAFLPLFLGRARNEGVQLAMLGVILLAAGLIADLAVGWTTGLARGALVHRPSTTRALAVATAVVYAGLAVLALVDAVSGLSVPA